MTGPMPTDLELLHDWMGNLAKRIDADARQRQREFQWFMFMLPLLWGIWGLVIGLIIAVARG